VFSVGSINFGGSLSVEPTLQQMVRNAFALADADSDGVPNASDNCPTIANVDQSDTDSDGVGQLCDNCTQIANPDQADADADGFGTVCDFDLDGDCNVSFVDLGELKALFFSANAEADFDGDGTVNFVDLGLMKGGFFLPPGPSGVPNACAAR
jgi:hypothetical protein